MTDYAAKARSTDAAFRRNGQKISITRKTPGAYVNGVVTVTTSTEDVWGIETGVTLRDLGIGIVNGTLVQSGDRKLMISALTDAGLSLTPPKVGDLALAGGVTYTVKNVDKLAPGGVAVMYTLVGRV
ncbi:MAG TPA: hypothetical protein VFW00_07105 [Rhodocyclaceae bacterium]|nr:hypothetical protein [Rhodocyclaceae bacterium]